MALFCEQMLYLWPRNKHPKPPMKRALYITLGILCVVAGAIGVVVPGLPTTPLVLAASWFFYRSSPRLQEWLLNSPLGARIRNYQRRGGMTRRTKVGVCLLMATMVAISALLLIKPLAIKIVVGCLGIVGLVVVIFWVPNAREN